MTTLVLCDCCAPAVVNGDWTHLDANPDTADTKMASIDGMLEILGHLTPEGDADEPGAFDCLLCNETQVGGGHTFSADPMRVS